MSVCQPLLHHCPVSPQEQHVHLRESAPDKEGASDWCLTLLFSPKPSSTSSYTLGTQHILLMNGPEMMLVIMMMIATKTYITFTVYQAPL